MKLLIATNNAGKVREYQHILRGLFPDVTLLTLAEAGIEHDVEETGDTFEANARLKAEGYSALSGLPVIADDSGLAVDALDGFPGVRSARWSGPTDEDRNRHLLEKLEEVPEAARGARFICVACFRTPDGQEALAYGEVEGRIGHAPRGEHGFGYDPLFMLPDGRSLSELPREEKNAISHRGRAARVLAPRIAALLGDDDRRRTTDDR